MISELIASNSEFSLQYDETTQVQVKKQMDLLIRFWSPAHNEVWPQYYKSLFLVHAKDENVAIPMIEEMRLTSWFSCMRFFFAYLSFSHTVSWVRCST